jgi:hypothetical protein
VPWPCRVRVYVLRVGVAIYFDTAVCHRRAVCQLQCEKKGTIITNIWGKYTCAHTYPCGIHLSTQASYTLYCMLGGCLFHEPMESPPPSSRERKLAMRSWMGLYPGDLFARPLPSSPIAVTFHGFPGSDRQIRAMMTAV